MLTLLAGYEERLTLFGIGSTFGSLVAFAANFAVGWLPYDWFFAFAVVHYVLYFVIYGAGAIILR